MLTSFLVAEAGEKVDGCLLLDSFDLYGLNLPVELCESFEWRFFIWEFLAVNEMHTFFGFNL